MFWIALAAQVVAPVSENPTGWFTPGDMPIDLVRRGPGLWQVPIRLTVQADGKVRSCDVEVSSGIRDLDRLTCHIATRRAKFQPARIEANPAYGVYRAVILWAVADEPWDTSKVMKPDIDVTVERLPAGVKSPTSVMVNFAVDAAGGKSSCAAHQSGRLKHVENHPALVPIACDQIMEKYPATPATDAAGHPIVSVQNATVRFSESRPN